LDVNELDRNGKYFRHDSNFEKKITVIGWVIFLVLVFEDIFSRIYIADRIFVTKLLLVQGSLYAVYIRAGQIYLKIIRKDKLKDNHYMVLQIIKIVTAISLVTSMYHGLFFYIFAFMPVLPISLDVGFKKTIGYIAIGWLTQGLSRMLMLHWLGNSYFSGALSQEGYFLVIIVQYLLFIIICYVCGIIYDEYAKSQLENEILVERLGDKYVQLEQAKKEIQLHYDKLREANDQLKLSNKKLSSSVAEFFTLQQISQAITSIFDMNELLRFVNDAIIGVMGAYDSTIALCYGTKQKLRVQVSSIRDKKDLAVVSDYINSDVLKPPFLEGHSMIDNNVTAEKYPFTKGRNIQSLICAPLVVKGNVVGIVLIEHRIMDAFDNENVRLLEIITQQVSVAIENTRLYKQMQDLARLDGLTGAYNRIFFQDALEMEYERALAQGYDLSLVIFDVDYFKEFNDRYGHLFGDLVLKSISAYVMKNLREEDIFARYGGEEFVVLMPHTTLDQAGVKAEDFRRGIEGLSITDRLISASVTISAGVSSFPASAGRPTELIKTSDDALYQAKRDGRNLVRLAPIREC